MRILVFGDSIAFGAYDGQGGWVDRIKKLYLGKFREHEDPVQVINLGISGDTSREVLARVRSEIETRHAAKEHRLVTICAVGVNDSRWVDQIGTPEVPLEEFADNVDQILQIMKEYTKHVLVLGLTPVASSSAQFKNYIYESERIREYDKVLKKAAEEVGAEHIDLLNGFAPSQELFFSDKLHPNDKGHQLVADLVLPVLKKSVQ